MTITPSFLPKGRVSIKGTQVITTRNLPLGSQFYENVREFKLTALPQLPGTGSERKGFGLCHPVDPNLFPFIYSFHRYNQMNLSGIRGLSTIPFERRGLLRPLLNIFFSQFPDIIQTHPKFAILPALNLLRLEYGFEPAGDSEPNVWFRLSHQLSQLYRFEIFFKDRPAQDLFMDITPPMHAAEFSLLGINPEPPAGFWPVTIGSSHVLKDRTAFQRALDLFPVTIET